jgi:S-layer homology domain
MPKGKIDQRYGSLTVYRGDNDSADPVTRGMHLGYNDYLNVRVGSGALIRFLNDANRSIGYAASVSPYSGNGAYVFPCWLFGGCGITFWANGYGSGCREMGIGVTYVAAQPTTVPATAPATVPAVVASATPLAASAQDVAIQELVKRKIMAGYPDGTFRPNGPVTRAEFASFVSAANLHWQVPETDRTIQFDDMPVKHWANPAIALAVRTGFLSGYQNNGRWRFQPDERIPRQQVLAALAGGLGLPMNDLPINDNDIPSVLKRYQDANLIAKWARPAVAAATQAGLIIDSASTLKPQQAVTRGETAILISKSLALKAKPEDRPVLSDDVLKQPPPRSSRPAARGPEVWVSPTTQEPTLVQVNSSNESGLIEVISLTSTVKIVAKPEVNGPEVVSVLQAGQRFVYRPQAGTYKRFVTVIEMSDRDRIIKAQEDITVLEADGRRTIINAQELTRFLEDWSEPQPLSRGQFEALLRDRLLTRDPKNSLNAAIVQAMNELGTFSTLPFIAPPDPNDPQNPPKAGENSCGWAVNQVLAQARIDSLDTYVPRVKTLLETKRGTLIKPDQAQAGDIVIAGSEQPGDEAHMGICIAANKVRSASKEDRTFSWETNLDFKNFFGSVPSTVYRLNS